MSKVVVGGEALLAIGRAQPDVVLCDYVLPVMDGDALVAAIRRDPPQRAQRRHPHR